MLTRKTVISLFLTCLLINISACSTRNLRVSYDDLRGEESSRHQGGGSLDSELSLQQLNDVSVQYYVQNASKARVTKISARSKDFYLFDGVDFDGAVETLMTTYFPKANARGEIAGPPAKLYYSFSSSLDIDSYTGDYRGEVIGAVYAFDGTLLYKDTFGRSERGYLINQSFVAHNVFMRAVDAFIRQSIQHIGIEKIISMPELPMLGYEDLKSGGRAGTGSAFFINDEGYLVTAAHVVNACSYIDIENQDGILNKLPVDVIAKNRFLDLAILKSDYHSKAYAELAASNKVDMGEDIWVFGYPLGSLAQDTLQMTSGSITSTGAPGKRSSAYLHFSAPIRSGNSGGVIMTKFGAAGVAQAAIDKEKLEDVADVVVQGNMNIGMASHAIKQYLELHNVDYRIQKYIGKRTEVIQRSKRYVTQVNCY